MRGQPVLWRVLRRMTSHSRTEFPHRSAHRIRLGASPSLCARSLSHWVRILSTVPKIPQPGCPLHLQAEKISHLVHVEHVHGPSVSISPEEVLETPSGPHQLFESTLRTARYRSVLMNVLAETFLRHTGDRPARQPRCDTPHQCRPRCLPHPLVRTWMSNSQDSNSGD